MARKTGEAPKENFLQKFSAQSGDFSKTSIKQSEEIKAPPKFRRYKHIKISGKWRHCRAATYSDGKVKPHAVVIGGQEEKHEEGSCCIRRKKCWIYVDTDHLAARRMRSKFVDQTEHTAVQPVAVTKGVASQGRVGSRPTIWNGEHDVQQHIDLAAS